MTKTPKPACSIDGCDNESAARGWCKRHYNNWHKHGDPLWTPDERPPAKTGGPCTVDGCDKPVRARGWCAGHWSHWRRNDAEPTELLNTGRKASADPNALTGGHWTFNPRTSIYEYT